MKWRVVGYALLAMVAMATAVYSAAQIIGRGLAEAGTPGQLTIQVQLDPDERLWGAAAGDLSGGPEPALVFGSLIPGGRGRIRVLHWQRGHYETVWTFTQEAGEFDGATIRDVNNNGRNDLITLWRSGQGGYLDIRIFEWNGQTYQEIWNLVRFEKEGQLTQAASLLIRRIDLIGNVELVVRAPNVRPGESTLGPVPHQVSIYRWDASRQTLVLFKRFVDPSRTLE